MRQKGSLLNLKHEKVLFLIPGEEGHPEYFAWRDCVGKCPDNLKGK